MPFTSFYFLKAQGRAGGADGDGAVRVGLERVAPIGPVPPPRESEMVERMGAALRLPVDAKPQGESKDETPKMQCARNQLSRWPRRPGYVGSGRISS